MPAAVSLHFIRIKAGGTALPAAEMQQCLSCEIESTYGQPDRCTLAFTLSDGTDPSRALELGTEMKVEMDAAEGANGAVTVFDGEVTAVEVESVTGRTMHIVHAYDRTHRLYRGNKTRSFTDKKSSDVASTMAGEASMTAEVTATSTAHPFLMQHNESNGDHLKRLADEVGFRFYADGQKLKFEEIGADASTAATLTWHNDLFALTIRSTTDAWVKTAKVHDWDMKQKQLIVGENSTSAPSEPAANLVQTAANGFGDAEALYVHTVLAQGDADKVAKSISTHSVDGATQAEGQCMGNPAIRLDKIIEIAGYAPRYNGKYRVSWVRHDYNSETGYTTSFSCRGATGHSLLQLVAQAAESDGQRSGEALLGVVPAIVTDIQDPDELGRVKVKFPTLLASAGSDWLRIALPSAGPDHGWFSLPEVEDEVLVAFERGDIRRGYILGGLRNGIDKPPSKADSIKSGKGRRWQFKTPAGGIFLFDDPGDGEHPKGAMELSMGDGKFVFKFDGDSGVVLEDTNSGHTIALTGDGDITIKSSNGALTIDAKNDLTIKAGGKITMEATGDLEMKGMSLKGEGTSGFGFKDGAGSKVEGAASGLTLQTSAIATLKGSLVQIN